MPGQAQHLGEVVTVRFLDVLQWTLREKENHQQGLLGLCCETVVNLARPREPVCLGLWSIMYMDRNTVKWNANMTYC